MQVKKGALTKDVQGQGFAFPVGGKLLATLSQVLLQQQLVVACNHHINIIVTAGHAPQKEVYRPTAGNIPRRRKGAQGINHGIEGSKTIVCAIPGTGSSHDFR